MESVSKPTRTYRTKTDSKREQLEVTNLHIKKERAAESRPNKCSNNLLKHSIQRKREFQIKAQQKVKSNND